MLFLVFLQRDLALYYSVEEVGIEHLRGPAEYQPPSIVQGDTALAASYRAKLVSTPSPGRVALGRTSIESEPDYVFREITEDIDCRSSLVLRNGPHSGITKRLVPFDGVLACDSIPLSARSCVNDYSCPVRRVIASSCPRSGADLPVVGFQDLRLQHFDAGFVRGEMLDKSLLLRRPTSAAELRSEQGCTVRGLS